LAENPRPLASYGQYIGLGMQIAASMVLPLLAGVWLDNKLETSPWFTLGGALFGILSIFGIILKIALYANNPNKYSRRDNSRK
jgi:F0F1-type ATP synthase assembly protein I